MVVGLGNPGAKYQGTRHNVGFDCIERLQKRLSGGTMPTTKFQGQLVRGSHAGKDILLVWPLTYMNASGQCVQQVAAFYKIPIDRIMVICDDMALPVGKLRIRGSGSAGGQKGLKDILRCMGSEAVPRLRIGIGACPEQWEAADYVLSRFRKDEADVIQSAVDRASEAILAWVTEGIEKMMNHYNRAENS